VLGNLSRDPLHVEGIPHRHVEVHSKEFDEHASLFRIEHVANMAPFAICAS
jgi:hypothetical protein